MTAIYSVRFGILAGLLISALSLAGGIAAREKIPSLPQDFRVNLQLAAGGRLLTRTENLDAGRTLVELVEARIAHPDLSREKAFEAFTNDQTALPGLSRFFAAASGVMSNAGLLAARLCSEDEKCAARVIDLFRERLYAIDRMGSGELSSLRSDLNARRSWREGFHVRVALGIALGGLLLSLVLWAVLSPAQTPVGTPLRRRERAVRSRPTLKRRSSTIRRSNAKSKVV